MFSASVHVIPIQKNGGLDREHHARRAEGNQGENILRKDNSKSFSLA